MDLRAEILKEHSREQSQKIAHWIGQDKARLQQLMDLFFQDEYRVVQRVAWIVSLVAEQHPGMIQPHLAGMVGKMDEAGAPVAVKRNVIRVLQFVDLPELLHGQVMNTCFDLLADPRETVAVRCFSMTVLANLATLYPDIKQELQLIIRDCLEQGATAGFRARAKRVLGSLN